MSQATSAVPPNDLDAEAAVLSALLLNGSRLDEVDTILKPRHFYATANARIFETIRDLTAEGRAIDAVTVAGRLRDTGLLGAVGGSPYIAQLADATPATAHVAEHAHRIVERWQWRQFQHLARTAAAEAGSGVGDFSASASRWQAALGDLVSTSEAAWPSLGVAGIFAPLEPVKYIIEPLDLCAGAPALVAGYGFSGKTVALQSAAVSIAAGQRVWGAFAARQGRVIHLDYEQGARLTRERYQRLAAGMMVTPDELAGRLELVSLPQVYLDSPGAEAFIRKKVQGFDLAIIDSLRASGPTLEENDSAVRGLLDGLNRVSEATGCCFIVVHHARKPAKDSPGGARMAIRGSGAIYDACSSVLILEADKGQPTRCVHEKARASGICADDFLLRIEDVEVGGNPRGGLSVLAEGASPQKPNAASAFQFVKERILLELEKGPAGSKSALAARASGRKGDKLAAIDELIAEGRIVVKGKLHELVTS